MPVHLFVLRLDWNRSRSSWWWINTCGSPLSARDPLTHVMFLLSYEWYRNNLINWCAECLQAGSLLLLEVTDSLTMTPVCSFTVADPESVDVSRAPAARLSIIVTGLLVSLLELCPWNYHSSVLFTFSIVLQINGALGSIQAYSILNSAKILMVKCWHDNDMQVAKSKIKQVLRRHSLTSDSATSMLAGLKDWKVPNCPSSCLGLQQKCNALIIH